MASRAREPASGHPIGVASHRTGLSRSVLRAWERRYGAVTPKRSEGGRRFYADEDLERLRLLLRDLIQTLQGAPDSPEVLVGTPSGEQHELGALLAGVTAAAGGRRVLVLGPNLPAPDIAEVARARRCGMVALSVVRPASDLEAVAGELLRLRRLLPSHVELTVGGAGALEVREALEAHGIRVEDDLALFRERLRNLRLAGN